jgi:hypothetical protein
MIVNGRGTAVEPGEQVPTRPADPASQLALSPRYCRAIAIRTASAGETR